MAKESVFPCAACGFLTFSEPPSSYDICPMCGWEDDHVQLAYPTMRGGANKESLYDAQLRALEKFPLAETHAKYKREDQWRPFSESEISAVRAGPKNGVEYFQAAANESPSYYWRNDV